MSYTRTMRQHENTERHRQMPQYKASDERRKWCRQRQTGGTLRPSGETAVTWDGTEGEKNAERRETDETAKKAAYRWGMDRQGEGAMWQLQAQVMWPVTSECWRLIQLNSGTTWTDWRLQAVQPLTVRPREHADTQIHKCARNTENIFINLTTRALEKSPNNTEVFQRTQWSQDEIWGMA